MAELSTDLIDRLTSGPVDRGEVARAIGSVGSISLILSRYARKMEPPHLVERHIRGSDILYRLRPTRPGEVAGLVKPADTIG